MKCWTKLTKSFYFHLIIGTEEPDKGKTLALVLTNSMTLEKPLNLVKRQWIQLCMGFMLQPS